MLLPRPKWSVPTVYPQCHAVYTVGTLQPMQCTCSMGCQHFCTLHIHCQQVAVYLQCMCSLHCSYTACTLHFGLGKHYFMWSDIGILAFQHSCHSKCPKMWLSNHCRRFVWDLYHIVHYRAGKVTSMVHEACCTKTVHIRFVQAKGLTG